MSGETKKTIAKTFLIAVFCALETFWWVVNWVGAAEVHGLALFVAAIVWSLEQLDIF